MSIDKKVSGVKLKGKTKHLEPIVLPGGEYEAEYVTMVSFKDRTLISHNKDPIKALKKAEEAGYPDPVIYFVPSKETMRSIKSMGYLRNEL